VAEAYGWDSIMLDDSARLLDALFDLNAQSAVDPNYAPFPKGKSDSEESLDFDAEE
jgi:hypothetical protein